MAETFAKLFDTDRGQILCIFRDNGSPEIVTLAKPPGLGVCESTTDYQDTDAGWAKAQEDFDHIDGLVAYELAKPIFEVAKILGSA